MLRLCLAVVLLTAALGLGPAEAAEAVKTRAAVHETYARIAFDWPAPVKYDAHVDGTTLTVHFDRPLATKLDQISRYLGAYLTHVAIDAGGTTLTGTLSRPVSLKTFTEGNTIAIDLVDAKPAAAKPAARAETPAAQTAAAPASPSPTIPEPAPAAAPAAAKPAAPAGRPMVLVPHDAAKAAAPAATAAAPTAAATAPAAQPSGIVVRFGEHDGYRRLVFDWKEPVDYSASESGDEAVIHFARPAHLDAARIGAALPGSEPTLSEEEGGTTLKLHLPQGTTVRHFRSGDSIVVDLLQPGVAAGRPVAKAAPPAAKKAAAPPVTPPPEIIEPSAGTSGPLPSGSQGGKGPPPATHSAPGPTSSTAPAPGPALSVHYAATSDTGSLRFPWTSAVPAAVFRRAGSLWVVFGARANADLSEVQLRGKAAVEKIEQVPHPLATVIRVVTRRGLEPSLHRVGDEWVIDLRAQELRPDTAITVSPQPQAKPPRVVFEMSSPGDPIVVTDPEVGDRLLVVPTTEVGRGLPIEAGVVDFRALVTLQGLVIRPNVDGVVIRPIATGVEVTGREGLVLSGDTDRKLAGEDDSSPRLFKFDRWLGPKTQSFLDRRSMLEQTVAAAPSAERSHPRLALAEFYLANGYAAETLGVLAAIERDDPTFAADKLVRAIKGAAAFLSNDLETANQEFRRPMMDGDPEVSLWRGALSASNGDWPAAAREYGKDPVLLTFYPKSIRNRLALLGAEAMIRSGQPDAAGPFLVLVTKDDPSPGDAAAAKYLAGLQAQAAGDLDRAQQLWQEVALTGDRPSRARALKDRTLALLKAGKISRTDAIRQLDDLRFAWRGGEFEFDLLHQLGTLLLADGDYRRGLDVLRQAATNFPNDPGTPAIQRDMAQAFSNVFLGPNSDNLSPLKAVAVYGEFKDLAGAQNDAIVRKLVDRMISVDLLDDADKLLADQVNNRLTGAEKARASTELAVIRLLDHRPEAALKALDLPLGGDPPPDLARQRQQLRARALTDLGRTDQAIAALANDTSLDADRLRADAYWKAQSWEDVARTLKRLVPAPGSDGTLAAKDARLALNLAAALSLCGDQNGLAEARDKYGAAMAKSPYADAFRLITSTDVVTPGDPRQQAQKLAELGELKSFAESLRKNLDATKVPATN
ncbi:MAG TPA: hypothetical protein VMC10_14555 [Stellaceae bacterium]|nr:hypothetical protein [Stellaceae bacterium]